MIDFVENCFCRLDQLTDSMLVALHEGTLKEALSYVCRCPGKRLRALLLYALITAYGYDYTAGDAAAMAIELAHLYSLVHDDLPMMDNDQYRRGQPCVHIMFGEAVGVLVGDALLPLAFQQMTTNQSWSADQKVAICNVLLKALGPNGILYGQTLDIANLDLTLPQLEELYLFKTGTLFSATFEMAGIITKQNCEILAKLTALGKYFGLLFQIYDDLTEVDQLDSSDVRNQRNTYPALSSISRAYAKIADLRIIILQQINTLKLQDTIFAQILDKYLK